jgi:hypothetical protein
MSYNENMQRLWREYEAAHGEEPTTTQECFEWATKNNKWRPRPIDVSKIFSRDMAGALRQEYRVDPSGRKYRAKVCIKDKIGEVQTTLWGDADKVTHKFFERSSQDRRKGIVNDCFLLKQDVDHFNEYRAVSGQIPLILDFADDVAELEALKYSPPEENVG